MQNARLTDQVRQTIRRTLAEFGAPTDAEMRETILIRDGLYCGRRFDCDGMQAIWFIEEDELKFYGLDGTVALVCGLKRGSNEDQHAA
jgi:hypothetical protein